MQYVYISIQRMCQNSWMRGVGHQWNRYKVASERCHGMVRNVGVIGNRSHKNVSDRNGSHCELAFV
jgi:hypothetical protein